MPYMVRDIDHVGELQVTVQCRQHRRESQPQGRRQRQRLSLSACMRESDLPRSCIGSGLFREAPQCGKVVSQPATQPLPGANRRLSSVDVLRLHAYSVAHTDSGVEGRSAWM